MTAFEPASIAFLVGRVLFGVPLALLGIDNLRRLPAQVENADSAGVPLPGVLVPAASAMLVVGSAAVILGVYPRIGAVLIAGFLAGVTPTMHAFWRYEGGERRSNRVGFLKNVGLLGGALVLVGVGGDVWSYAVVGL